MGELTVQEYVVEQFRRFAQPMWPDGIQWGSEQHRDIVRTFLAGAYIMDPRKTTDLEQLLSEAADEFWFPDSEWNWPTAEQN